MTIGDLVKRYLLTESLFKLNFQVSMLTTITLSAVQSSAQTFIHNVILFIDTSNNA